ncbi:hypothetical protein [Thermomonospora umbrina]|uniref:Uncharacterized protein n=1 Tax=Thermomonospora umbrina TaxID=111806 RepID=A0A3D9SRY7_9ACTN|nr:hypothetical protein [Thermomonospora umbrina]REE98702.1 hypothetical protein DFJ69_4195 [Thermomonospora umbrina]
MTPPPFTGADDPPSPKRGPSEPPMRPERIAERLDRLTRWGERTPTTRRHPVHREYDLADLLGLPQRLPPVRLPLYPELAEDARVCHLLARARELAEWLGDEGRVCPRLEELGATDALEAARDLGVPASDPAAVRGLRDLPELRRLWRVAVDCGFVDFDGDRAGCAAQVAAWDGADDTDVLLAWRTALTAMLDLDLLTELDDGALRFGTSGGTLMILLFLARWDGLSAAHLSEVLREGAVRDLPAGTARELWANWTVRNGDPAEILLAWLEELGAVERCEVPVTVPGAVTISFTPLGVPIEADPSAGTTRVARLTPLGLWAVRDQLTAGGLDVPLLPEPADMSIADLVGFAQVARPGELAVEKAAWLTPRDPAWAARGLLEYAAESGPVERVFAVVLASSTIKDHVGVDTAEAIWREAMGHAPISAYAKTELAVLTGGASPDLATDVRERSWMLVDLVLAHTARLPEDFIPARLQTLLDAPADKLVGLIEPLTHCTHPSVREALDLLGTHFPLKKVAKAARRTLFKVSSRSN